MRCSPTAVPAASAAVVAVLLTGCGLTSAAPPERDGDAVVACRRAVEAELGATRAPDRLGVPVARVTVSNRVERYVVEGRTAAAADGGSVDFRCDVAYEPGADDPLRVAEVVLA